MGSIAGIVALIAIGAPSVDALLAGAEAARARGELAESLRLVQEAYTLDPSPALLNNVGVLQAQLGRYGDAAASYRAVIADPRTPAQLRKLDEQRLAELAPRLERAWLSVVLKPADAVLLVDGARTDARAELGLEPGRRALEVHRGTSGEVVCRLLDLQAGLRTVVELDLDGASPEDAWLVLEGVSPPITTLELDGYRVRAPIFTRTRLIRVAAGTFRVAAARSDGEPARFQVTLAPGESLALSRHPALAPPQATAALPLAAPPAPPARVEERSAVWPLIAAGAGLVAATAGFLLVRSAEGDRDTVENAPRDPRGVIVGLTFAEASALEADANTKANAGAGLIGGGAVVLTGGLVWWLLSSGG